MRGVSRGRRERWLTTLVCSALLAVSVPAFGQASPDELARRHFESGAAYLEESDYENALEAFDKAYELSKRPEIQINIATVYERMGRLKQAIGALDRYLELAPEGELRETVELRKANLQKRVDAGEGVEPAPKPQPEREPKAAAKPPPPAPKPEPKTSKVPVQDDGTTDAGPNVPAWILIGLGGLSAGGAVVTGLLAQSEYDTAKSDCSPTCTDDQLSTGRNMALTSTILTGVAVVGIGVGLTLLFTSSSSPQSASRVPAKPSAFPQVFVGASTAGGAFDARWRF
ncbi:MAG: tetratricopeptide repeat protein [Polyangiaceae bacterium]|nr:tetratricopeptide repeat protein [Myxococcales bacterium]MCB9588458.1 tetratricopeptide repeat protein [Polyangiaceae bacterium]